MTPKERARLAEALTAASGQPWRVAGHIEDPAVEGVCREVGRPVGIFRAGGEGFLVTEEHERRRFPGTFKGRGWLPAFVVAALNAVAEYDGTVPRSARTSRSLSERDQRRAKAYRAILAPGSNASESERAQARGHLERLGVA